MAKIRNGVSLTVKSPGNLSFLPTGKQKEITAMLKVYIRIDRTTDHFKSKTSLHCPPGCGDCCQKACVAASVLEMQPAALYLYHQGEWNQWMAKVDRKDEQAKCVFYSPATLENSGHCRIYPFRPLVCRLFGFSVRMNKRDKDELMICRVIKDQRPQDVAEAEAMIGKGLKATRPTDYFLKSYAIAPTQAKQCMNINHAFLRAAEAVLLSKRFKEASAEKGRGKKTNADFSLKKKCNLPATPLGAEPAVIASQARQKKVWF